MPGGASARVSSFSVPDRACSCSLQLLRYHAASWRSHCAPQGGGTMGKMLNLAEGLLWKIRSLQHLGRCNDALSLLTRLSRLRELPRAVAEETQARLGEVQLQRKQFRRAHRHLTLALRYDPDN